MTHFPAGGQIEGGDEIKRGRHLVVGEPAAVRAPVAESIKKTETVPAIRFATYRNWPEGSATVARGPALAAKGEPEIAASAPVAASIENAEMLLDVSFIT